MSILVLTSDTLIGTPATGNLEYNGQFYGTDSALSRAQMQRITQGTAVASTSGTSIDFISLPAWVKRITVMFNGVSTNGTSNYQLQIGSGSISATSYISSAAYLPNASGIIAANSTTGLLLVPSTAASTLVYGQASICLIGSNTWTFGSALSRSDTVAYTASGVSPALSGSLDRVRITTVNGTDTFDAGSINILYEG
jgi:hypothetical protein